MKRQEKMKKAIIKFVIMGVFVSLFPSWTWKTYLFISLVFRHIKWVYNQKITRVSSIPVFMKEGKEHAPCS